MKDTAIKAEHLSKEYRTGSIGGGTLRGDLQSLWARICRKEDPNSRIGGRSGPGGRFLALDDLSFEVKKGESLGIIGHNGAGKSTLLKILSRVTVPSSGTVFFRGRIASMLEVGTGFHPELTGRENVYMNGAILGMRKSEIDKKFDEIVEFAEIPGFIDTPVKRYSSGMYVKLAFSVLAHLDSEIMIMDEVLAVGDANFQEKCLNQMKNAVFNGKTVLYVSHNMSTIKRLCQRCLLLKNGHLEFAGDPSEAIRLYRGAVVDLTEQDLSQLARAGDYSDRPVSMKYIALTNTDGGRVETGGFLKGFLDYISSEDLTMLSLNFLIRTSGGDAVAKSESANILTGRRNQKSRVKFKLNIGHLVPGKYTLGVFISQKNQSGFWKPLDCLYSVVTFSVAAAPGFNGNAAWDAAYWGNMINDPVEIEIE